MLCEFDANKTSLDSFKDVHSTNDHSVLSMPEASFSLLHVCKTVLTFMPIRNNHSCLLVAIITPDNFVVKIMTYLENTEAPDLPTFNLKTYIGTDLGSTATHKLTDRHKKVVDNPSLWCECFLSCGLSAVTVGKLI